MARIDPVLLPKALFSLLLLMPLFFLSTTTLAATFTVLNTDDSGPGSLRQAIIDANDEVVNMGPDEIVFADGVTGTITILLANGEMAITSDITITGPPLDIDDMPQVIIDAYMNSRIFNIDNPAEDITVSITRLELTNGMATGVSPDSFGGAILNNENLSIDSCVFHRNNADTQGGAILNGGIITSIANSIFSENRAGTSSITGLGGAILNFGGTIIEIADTTFSFNSAESGGAILNTGAIIEITNSTFDENAAVKNGGAISNNGGTITKITNSIFSFNRAEDMSSSGSDDSQGGAIFNRSIINSITKSTFSFNSAGNIFGAVGNGGAIFNEGTIDELRHSTFDMNFVFGGSGGAINNDGTITIIKKSTFDMNISDSNGGAINNDGIITDISHNTFNGNFANDGGAIFNFDGPIAKITHSMFTDNIASQSGGAIFNFDGTTIMEISYSTFNGNNVAFLGGAIHNEGTINTITKSAFETNMGSAGGAIANQGDMVDLFPGTIDEITHSTFTDNMAGTFGGAIQNSNAIITAMTNCTLSGNIAQLGGAIANVDSFATMNISFSTIANNTATNNPPIPMLLQFGGGIFNGPGTMNIKNSMVGDNINTNNMINTPDNCLIEMGGTFISLGGNFDTDASCLGFTQVTSAALGLDPAGPQDNGGPTETIALCTGVGTPLGCAGTSIAINEIPLVSCTDVAGVDVGTDQRIFSRPEPGGTTCDSGAFEEQPTGAVTVQKITNPMGGTGFKFECRDEDSIKLKSFKLDDLGMDICIFPVGMASIDEQVPMGYLLDIMCTDDDTPIVTDDTGVTLEVGEGEQIVCTFTNTEGVMLTVEIDPLGTGTGRVTSDDGGIDCGSTANDCEETYDDNGTEVMLTANPDDDTFFVGWSGDGACTGTDPMITLTMDQNINCTATFNRDPVTISVDKDGNGDGLISSDPAGINCPAGTCTSTSAMFPFGSPVMLTATADDTSVFTGWLGTGDCTGDSATITLDADMDINCTAQFVLIQFPLTITLSGNPDGDSEVRSADGNISCGTQCTFDYDIGTDVMLEADPSDNFRFVQWSGACSGTDPMTTVNIAGATMCDAEFALKQFDVTVMIEGTGMGTVEFDNTGAVCPGICTQTFDIGTKVNLIGTSGPMSLPVEWSSECEMGMITDLTQDTTCTATFNRNAATITADKMGDGDGLITSDPAGINCPAETCTSDSADFDFGTNVDLTAAPDGDSVFVEWTGPGDCPSDTPTTTVLADTAKTCTAKFDIQQFDVTVAIIGQGEVAYTPGGAVCPGDCIETFNLGTTVTLTPTAAPGWQFVEWNGPDDCEDGIIQNLTTDIICTAIFNQPVSPTAQANISLNKTVSPSTVEVGEEVAFMFNVTNSGPDTAPGVNVTDPLPSSLEFVSGSGCSETGGTVSCNLGSIANGGSETVSIIVIPTEPGEITNTATADSGAVDTSPGNNSSSATINVTGVPSEDEELIVEAETQEISAEPGSTISIPVNINNPETPETSIFLETRQTVTGATFTVDIPEGFDIEQLQSTKGVCDIELGECEIGEIIPGETVIVVVDATASDMEGVFNISFMVTTDTGQTFSGSAVVRIEGEEVNVDGGGCAVAGPNTKTTSLLGLLLYAFIPAVVVVRRRFKKRI